mmetsp:Transcript_9745/g.23890  ORF Transcript_9745/g.23890 Transcript_9745/m.23890 type:complete len:340 (-) Transcript_9745:327-1346(-)|eukprot:CAMPEP_0113474904 /NCGR_PEP_ID=MMETSP0014_2-20120614/18835_1 /TAXON_ID=2857 /ORGANISM="Nitzschia sp." /LENGTH=339 /DNA_ID=CAMNT_0000367787 /DNA_START=125 /DNA_END=1144 /DNA_ORIENTATION=+ /assembly_acc=CAM_ASM_000159
MTPAVVTAAAAAKNTAFVAKYVTDALRGLKDDDKLQSSQLLTDMQQYAAKRTLFAYGRTEDYEATTFAPSPLFARMVEGFQFLADNKSRILYAPPSSGKTSAAKMLMKVILKKYDCPALMFTGCSTVADYFSFIVDTFPQYKDDPALVMKCLVASLTRSVKATQGSPWLILDEFNHEGPDRVNMIFAETLFRQVAELHLNFHVLFITQSEEMAKQLLDMNSWQKIAPFENFTSPDSTTITSAEKVPNDFNWIHCPWTKHQLSMVVFLRYPDLKKDKDSIITEADGTVLFKLLKGDENPWSAEKLGSHRMSELAMKQQTGDDPSALKKLAEEILTGNDYY